MRIDDRGVELKRNGRTMRGLAVPRPPELAKWRIVDWNSWQLWRWRLESAVRLLLPNEREVGGERDGGDVAFLQDDLIDEDKF